jgi:hypothetical protein
MFEYMESNDAGTHRLYASAVSSNATPQRDRINMHAVRRLFAERMARNSSRISHPGLFVLAFAHIQMTDREGNSGQPRQEGPHEDTSLPGDTARSKERRTRNGCLTCRVRKVGASVVVGADAIT